MTLFDQLFFSIFNHYKPKFKSKANDIALFYILLVQASLLLLIATLLRAFLNRMHTDILSGSKILALGCIIMVVLMFRNWMYYTGKKRKILNAHSNQNKALIQNTWLLWGIPFGVFTISMICMQSI